MYKQEEKSLSIQTGEIITIKKIVNPITGESSFLITNDPNGCYNEIITKDIVIDGMKLECD